MHITNSIFAFAEGVQELVACYGIKRQLVRKFPTAIFEAGIGIKGDLNNLLLGQNTIIQFGAVLHLGGMEWCQMKGLIKLGDRAVISPHCVLYGAGPGGIIAGDDFDCGPSVGIFSSRTDYKEGKHLFAPVRIGDRVTIFSNSVIGPGVTLGNDSVVAAGAVVLSDVPAGALVGGVPAKLLRLNARELG